MSGSAFRTDHLVQDRDAWSGRKTVIAPRPSVLFEAVGALAKLDKAPVSKTGDSRFESWVPRLSNPAPRAGFVVSWALQRPSSKRATQRTDAPRRSRRSTRSGSG